MSGAAQNSQKIVTIRNDTGSYLRFLRLFFCEFCAENWGTPFNQARYSFFSKPVDFTAVRSNA
jgi:hypothetical protein